MWSQVHAKLCQVPAIFRHVLPSYCTSCQLESCSFMKLLYIVLLNSFMRDLLSTSHLPCILGPAPHSSEGDLTGWPDHRGGFICTSSLPEAASVPVSNVSFSFPIASHHVHLVCFGELGFFPLSSWGRHGLIVHLSSVTRLAGIVVPPPVCSENGRGSAPPVQRIPQDFKV